MPHYSTTAPVCKPHFLLFSVGLFRAGGHTGRPRKGTLRFFSHGEGLSVGRTAAAVFSFLSDFFRAVSLAEDKTPPRAKPRRGKHKCGKAMKKRVSGHAVPGLSGSRTERRCPFRVMPEPNKAAFLFRPVTAGTAPFSDPRGSRAGRGRPAADFRGGGAPR